MEQKKTSWQGVSKWYGEIVGEKGHFFHQSVVIPKSLGLLKLQGGERFLDVACGQGVFGRATPQGVDYVGFDIAKDLVSEAIKLDRNKSHKYFVANATEKIKTDGVFDKAVVSLALQNIKEPEKTIKNISEKVKRGGKLLIVLNHPCFRIPRQSSWEIDKGNKLEYRRVNRYMTPLEVPINMHPGDKNSPVTWSFHHPLSDYSKFLNEADFLIETIEEWTSPKTSVGKSARQENRAREEFPLFMAILCVKN